MALFIICSCVCGHPQGLAKYTSGSFAMNIAFNLGI